MHRFALFIIGSAMSASALAAPDTFIFDAKHSFAYFSYNHLGYSTQMSRFDKTRGKMTLDFEAKTGSVEVAIATNSVNTGSAEFNEHIQREEFLDTEHYPTATFLSKKLNFKAEKIVSIDGMLTLKGVSKPISLNVTSFHCMLHPMLMKKTCGANATATLKRTDFNMGQYAPLVSDEVSISIAVEAVKE